MRCRWLGSCLSAPRSDVESHDAAVSVGPRCLHDGSTGRYTVAVPPLEHISSPAAPVHVAFTSFPAPEHPVPDPRGAFSSGIVGGVNRAVDGPGVPHPGPLVSPVLVAVVRDRHLPRVHREVERLGGLHEGVADVAPRPTLQPELVLHGRLGGSAHHEIDRRRRKLGAGGRWSDGQRLGE